MCTACVPGRHVTTMRRVSEVNVNIKCAGLDILRVLWSDRFCISDSS